MQTKLANILKLRKVDEHDFVYLLDVCYKVAKREYQAVHSLLKTKSYAILTNKELAAHFSLELYEMEYLILKRKWESTRKKGIQDKLKTIENQVTDFDFVYVVKVKDIQQLKEVGYANAKFYFEDIMDIWKIPHKKLVLGKYVAQYFQISNIDLYQLLYASTSKLTCV